MPSSGDRALEADRRVEVGEGGRGRRVRVVVRGDEHGLERGDRALAGRRDPLLEAGHLGGQVRLVADRRRHPPEQRRHLGARLGEAEDVVDEQEDVAALLVAEVLGHRQAGQADPLAGAGRLVHLAEHERRALDDARLGHLVDEVVALARPLAHAGEHRHARVLLRDVVDELLDDDGLADAGAAEDPDLAALLERADEVDDLEPGLEHLDLGGLVLERGRGAVDRQHLVRLDLALAVDGVAEHVEHAPQRHLAHRHGDRGAGVADLGPAGEAVGRRHGDGADPVVAQVLLHLAHERRLAFAQDLDGAEDRGQVPGGELDVDDRPGDLDHPAVRGRRGGRHGGECLLVCAWPSGPGRRSRSRPSRE